MTRPKFNPSQSIVADGGKPSQLFRDFMLALDGGALPQRRSLHGGVDRNPHQRTMPHRPEVAPFTGAWIETS